MQREQIFYVLFEQQKQWKEKREYVPREVLTYLQSLLPLKLPIVVTGIRRSGKSTLLFLLKQELGLEEKEYLYINFNDERFVDFSNEDFQKIIEFLEEEDYSQRCFLFIDEIQEVAYWEKWVDRIKEKYPMVITGSNSKLSSKEISTILTGRSMNKALYPFSFFEFLHAKKVNSKNFQKDLSVQAKLRKAFLEYSTIGGIPKVVIDADLRLLSEIYENIIYRDIIKRFHPNLEKSIKEISLFLLSNVSKPFSQRALSEVIGIKNFLTLRNIINTFEQAFLFYYVSKFDFSVKKQIQNPRKIYCTDVGFVNQLGFRNSEDRGRILENLVFLELKRREKEIYYFAEKNECDFVLRNGLKIKEAIQVCYDLHQENRERELAGLIEAMNKFGLQEGLILTYDHEEEISYNRKKIYVVPCWKWILLGKV